MLLKNVEELFADIFFILNASRTGFLEKKVAQLVDKIFPKKHFKIGWRPKNNIKIKVKIN
jgi:hypothetical protein